MYQYRTVNNYHIKRLFKIQFVQRLIYVSCGKNRVRIKTIIIIKLLMHTNFRVLINLNMSKVKQCNVILTLLVTFKFVFVRDEGVVENEC